MPGYVLEELLGRGGSGEVWRARPRGSGPPVAVKVLLRGDPERQVREAALLAELDHPHLVRLHQVVRRRTPDGEQVALVLDLLAGGSLAALLAARGRLRPGEVVTAIAPVAAALAHVHEQGIVHGDLSPGNVVLTAEGRPVLTDLGVARPVGAPDSGEVTPPYVDPVVARGGAAGPASDVFGVAAAAFHALTGIPPWNAAGPDGALAVAASGQVPDLALLAPEAPAELVAVVVRGLSPHPHLRGSAAEFALDLRHACRPERIAMPAPGADPAAPHRADHVPRTELTHQVRRPRAHAAPQPPGRWTGLREEVAGALPGTGAVLRRAAAALAVVGAVLVAVWAGVQWGRPDAGTVPAARTQDVATAGADPTVADPAGADTAGAATSGAATSGADPTEADPTGADPTGADPTGAGTSGADPTAAGTGGAATGASPAGVPDPGGAPGQRTAPGGGPRADSASAPADAAGWAALLGELYGRRAEAFTSGRATDLTGVYTPTSSLLAVDAERVTQLVADGQRLTGFAPEVVTVDDVAPVPGGVQVVLTDRVPGYSVVTDGEAQAVAARAERTVVMTVLATGSGWRIDTAARTP